VISVFPFSSEKKVMTTIAKESGRYIAYTKGSPEKIFRSCGMEAGKFKETEEQITGWQKKACRIIAFAHKPLDGSFDEDTELNEEALHSGMTFDGFAAISDPLRADVFEAVNQCRLAGVDLKILTGDNIVTARAIANDLGVLDENHKAVETREIENLSDEKLSEELKEICVIARSTPVIKMRVVGLLKAMGNVVAVTGDGINDAPALKNADVGIAMGITGTEVSKEASDIVLLDDSFSTIVNAIRWGRGIYENFKRFMSFQLTANISSVLIVLTSVLMGFKAPFTALELLWINIIMDGPPALSLGLEPIYSDLMKRPPVKRSENILSRSMLVRVGITGLFISTMVLLQYAFNFLGAGPGQTRTVLFALFSLFLLFNSFNCRELQNQSIFKNFLKNRLMLMILGTTFVLQVLIIQYAGIFFGTVPLPVSLWLKVFAVAFSVVAASEIIKLIAGGINRE
jgi:Ca2+-transporting ATPase